MGRFLGPEDYGVYAYWLALIVLITTPVRIGTAQVLTRYTASYQAEGEVDLIRGLWFRHVEWIVLFALVVAGILVVLIRTNASVVLGAEYQLAYISLVLLILLPLADSLGGGIRGLHRPVLGQMPEYVARPVGFVFLLVLALGMYGSGWLTPVRAMSLYVAAAAVAAILAALMARRTLPRTSGRAQYREREWFSALVPLSFAAGMFVVNAQVDVVLLGWLTDQSQVGVYRIFGQGAMSVLLPITAFNLVVAPQVARLYRKREFAQLQRLVRWEARWVFLCVLGTSFLGIAFGEFVIITLLGEAFVRDYEVFVLLVLSQILSAAFGPVALVLNMTGHERAALRGIVSAAIVNVVANLILIPYLGMMGAAVSTVLSVLLWSYLLYRATRESIGINPAIIGSTLAGSASEGLGGGEPRGDSAPSSRLLMMVKTLEHDSERYWLTDELLTEFSRRGHQVHVLVFDRTASRREESYVRQGVHFYIYPMAPWPARFSIRGYVRWSLTWIRAWVKAFARLRNLRFDLVVNFSIASYFWGLTRLLKLLHPGTRSLLVLWDFFPRHQVEIGRLSGGVAENVLYELEAVEIKGYDFIGVMSKRNHEYLSQYHPNHRAEVFIVPVWADATTIDSDRRHPKRDRFTVVFGGQLTEGRGVDQIIRVADRARDELPHVRFLVIGDGNLYPWAREQVSQRELFNVELVKRLSRKRYLQLLAAECDAGLVITVPGVSVPTFPSKVVDFMRCSLPVIACVETAGDFGDIIQNEAKCGIRVDNGDDDALIEAIRCLSLELDEEQRNKLGENGREFFKANMTVGLVAAKLETVCLGRESYPTS